jgi:hypothetical protein
MARVKPKKEQFVTEDGTVLTDAMIEELADEAERGYELSKLAPQGVGRPPLGDGGPSPRLSFRVSLEEFDAARRKAEEEDISVSELVREAIRRHLSS